MWVLFLLPFLVVVYFRLPTRCGSCGAWGTIRGKAFGIAGETIFKDAHCTKCETEMYVDDAGYIRHSGFLWLSTIPLASRKPDAFQQAAETEVELFLAEKGSSDNS